MKEHNYGLQNADTCHRLQSRMQNICFVISISAVILKLMVKITSIESIFGLAIQVLKNSMAWHFRTFTSPSSELEFVYPRVAESQSKCSSGFAKSRPAARRPSPDFPQFFCPAVNPRASTDLHWVWVCKTDGSKFEFVYHFNHLNLCFCLLHVVQIRTFSFSVHTDRGLFIIERCKLFSNHTVKTHN